MSDSYSVDIIQSVRQCSWTVCWLSSWAGIYSLWVPVTVASCSTMQNSVKLSNEWDSTVQSCVIKWIYQTVCYNDRWMVSATVQLGQSFSFSISLWIWGLMLFKERFNLKAKHYGQIKRENPLVSLSVSQGLKLMLTNSQNASDFQLIICKWEKYPLANICESESSTSPK